MLRPSFKENLLWNQHYAKITPKTNIEIIFYNLSVFAYIVHTVKSCPKTLVTLNSFHRAYHDVREKR